MEGLAEEKARLEKQVEAREKEIARLGKELGADSHIEQVKPSGKKLYIVKVLTSFTCSTCSLKRAEPHVM